MKLDRKAFRVFGLVVLLARGLPALAQPAAAPQPAPNPPNAVILDLVRSGGELTATQQEAVERSILAMAKSADVVLCQGGRSTIADPDLESLCARPDRDLPRLQWTARIAPPRAGAADFLRLNLELEAGATQLVLLLSTPLPPASGEATDVPAADPIDGALSDLGEVRDWFAGLRRRQDLVRPWPSPKVAVESKKPEPRKKIEIHGAGSKETTRPAVSGSDVFLVREALVGGGFRQGTTGNLRVSPTGLGFTLRGKDREEWSIPWRDLKEVSKDAGDWDVPHALVVIDRNGRKRYLARLDGAGGYLPGDSILDAIRRKRSAKVEKAAGDVTEL